MLPLIVILAVTSTAAGLKEESEEEVFDEAGPVEDDEYEYEYVYEDEGGRLLSAEDERWFSERAFHVTFQGGARLMLSERIHLTGELGIGFSQRLSQRWALQGRAAIGFGVAKEDALPIGSHAVFESSVDLTARLGSRRFYFGFGSFGRFWRVLIEGESFIGGGGALVEIGWLLGVDRQLDVGLRANMGLFADPTSNLQLLAAIALSVGWTF